MAVMETDAVRVRSLEQRFRALERANDVRSYRAELKRELKRGSRHPGEVLCWPDDRLLTMRVSELLMAMPRYGRARVSKALARSKISPGKTIGGLTERQRRELQVYLPALRVSSG